MEVKLLFCPECGDVVQMVSTYRDCRCRAAKGRYVDDSRVEVFGERTQVIGLDSSDLRAALDVVQSGVGDVKRPVITAYMHPRMSGNVIRRGRERRGL